MSKRYQAAILTASYNGLKVPNAPTIGTATASGLSASVTFAAPSNIGGGAITGYTVVSSPGNITATGSSSPVTVSGLTSGTSYTFTVVANNAYGSGPASAASNSITAVDPNAFIENLFSPYLYTGNGSTQTITNNLDLSGSGGLVWIKGRNNSWNNILQDTNRGINSSLCTNNRDGAINPAGAYISSFNSNGFSIGNNGSVNFNTNTYVSWTFREQAKFFDCGTYTGNGAVRTIPHNLGSVPGCMIVKRTDVNNVEWEVYHRSTGNTKVMWLNATDAAFTYDLWNNTDPTATEFTVSGTSDINANGGTFVYYLFAHNAGGFGLTGTDNVISCGSYTTDGSGVITSPVNLGYEPQWILSKRVDSTGNWRLIDSMRGNPVADGTQKYLYANLSDAETGSYGEPSPTSTGFTVTASTANSTYIYIAIRRGPMAVPTTGTSVFSPIATTASTGTKLTTNFPVDLSLTQERGGGGAYWMDRLRGALSPGLTGNTPYLQSSNTGAETLTTITNGWDNTGLNVAYFGGVSAVWWNLRRAPSFFDEVCYTGTGSATTVTHNLGVAPELVIVKRRDTLGSWLVYSSSTGATNYLLLNGSDPSASATSAWNNTAPTSSVFTVGTSTNVNASGSTYVAYLFATASGVSKVGGYTGTGTTLQINCGFTSGSRFVIIKRTDGDGDWYVWDSARGIVSGNDPYLLLNSTAAEVTNTDYVDTYSAGFEISSTAPAGINASGGTYIFLAIA